MLTVSMPERKWGKVNKEVKLNSVCGLYSSR